MTGPRTAVGLAAAWTVVLLLLATAWVRSPFTGPGPMFGVWSLVALPLTLWTLGRVRRWGLGSIPTGGGASTGVGLLWLAAGWAAASTRPALWSLDGFILREPVLHVVGTGLQWLPGLFGLALSVAGLSVALEARYRLARPGPSAGETPGAGES